MNHTKVMVINLFAGLVFSQVVSAYDGLDLYDCVISDKDRFNSRGMRLTDVRAILAQDRANYHRFGHRDVKDSGDVVFATPEGRMRWRSVRLTIDPALRKKIISGGDVEITIFVFTEDWVEVREGLLDPNVS